MNLFRSLILVLGQVIVATMLQAQVVAHFPVTFGIGPEFSVEVSDIAHTDSGDIVVVGNARHNELPSVRFPFMVRINQVGVVIWENHYPELAAQSSEIPGIWFNGILRYEDHHIIIGYGHIDAMEENVSGVLIFVVNSIGDVNLLRHIDLGMNHFSVRNAMLRGNELILSGDVRPIPYVGPPFVADGLVIRVPMGDNSPISEIYQDGTHDLGSFSSRLTFSAIDVDRNGDLRLVAERVAHDSAGYPGLAYREVFGIGDSSVSLITQDRVWTYQSYVGLSCGVTQGQVCYADTTSIFGYLLPHTDDIVCAQVSAQGVQERTIQLPFLPPGHVVESLIRPVRYGDMYFVSGTSWAVGTSERRFFGIALHHEANTPVWHYLSTPADNWWTGATALDSANGILVMLARYNNDVGTIGENRLYRFDLRRIYPFVLSVESNENDEDVYLWPNPFDDQLQLNISSFGTTYSLTITDMQGRQLMEDEINNGQTSISTDNLPAGLYTVTVTDNAGSVVSQRMVKLNR